MRLTLLILCIGLAQIALVQNRDPYKMEQFALHYGNAQNSKAQNRYAEALQELILTADHFTMKGDEYKAKTLAAEIFRITGDHEKGFEILWSIEEHSTPEELSFRITRYGRLAALHHESVIYRTDECDSVIYYIDTALVLANSQSHRFQRDIAALKNELGFYLYRKGITSEARSLYQESANIYKGLGDMQYYAEVLNNLLDLETCAKNMNASDSLVQILENVINGEEWLLINARAYQYMTSEAQLRGDSLDMWRYKYYSVVNYHKHHQKLNSDKMIVVRELYETEKLKKEMQQQEQINRLNQYALDEEKKKKQRLVVYIIIGLIVLFLILLVLARERKLKQKLAISNDDLKVANNKYQMLVTESNHRIKNNLQMIISMMEYSTEETSDIDKSLLQGISGKIYTISALHRHLNFDHHNEKLSMRVYFREVIDHYQNIHDDKLSITLNVLELKFPSETLIYFGLILNELISNTIKHGNGQFQIKISVSSVKGFYVFLYEDGQALPESINEGKGLQLIRGLLGRVEGENLQIINKQGIYKFSFHG